MGTRIENEGEREAAPAGLLAAPPRLVSGRLAAAATLLALTAASLAACGQAGPPAGEPAAANATAAAGSGAAAPSPGAAGDPAGDPARNAYFGDLHVHTNWSLDAFHHGRQPR